MSQVEIELVLTKLMQSIIETTIQIDNKKQLLFNQKNFVPEIAFNFLKNLDVKKVQKYEITGDTNVNSLRSGELSYTRTLLFLDSKGINQNELLLLNKKFETVSQSLANGFAYTAFIKIILSPEQSILITKNKINDHHIEKRSLDLIQEIFYLHLRQQKEVNKYIFNLKISLQIQARECFTYLDWNNKRFIDYQTLQYFMARCDVQIKTNEFQCILRYMGLKDLPNNSFTFQEFDKLYQLQDYQMNSGDFNKEIDNKFQIYTPSKKSSELNPFERYPQSGDGNHLPDYEKVKDIPMIEFELRQGSSPSPQSSILIYL